MVEAVAVPCARDLNWVRTDAEDITGYKSVLDAVLDDVHIGLRSHM